MRQIFSVRFFAAVGAVVGLVILLVTVLSAQRAIDGDADEGGGQLRAIDLVDRIESASDPRFALDADGMASVPVRLTIDASRAVSVFPGTPGVDHCGRLAEPGACAIVADLLGEAVVWFALVPMGDGGVVPLPAVASLEDGVATLVNGWQLPHAPAFERRCGDEVFESYRQFRQVLGDDFTALYDLVQRRLTAVVCRQRVSYAPAATTP